MSDKIYKVILLGKIADGYDIEIVHEKLALIFDIDLKKIKKLLKKPTVIRTELTYDVAVRYRTGLEKIGVLCEIKPPLETDSAESSPTAPETIPELEELEEIRAEEPEKPAQPEVVKFAPIGVKLSSDRLQIVDINVSVGAMSTLFIKILLTNIPVAIILGGIIFVIYQAIVIGNFM